MSADNYYYVRKREDGKFEISHRFASSDYDSVTGLPESIAVFDSLEEAVMDAHRRFEEDPTEYGVVVQKGLVSGKEETKTIQFGCCFCGQVAEADDRVAVALFRNDELLQQWWAHEGCFRGKLDPGFNVQVPDASDLWE